MTSSCPQPDLGDLPPRRAGVQLRVLPAQDRQGRREPDADGRGPRSERPARLHLGHLRRRRLHPGSHAPDRHPDPVGARGDGDGASTCVGATSDEIGDVVGRLEAAGVRNVLALRGDAPEGTESFEATDGGFAYASDLIAFLSEHHDVCIGGGLLSGGAPRGDLGGRGSRLREDQAGRRGLLPHHSALLRRRPLQRLRRARARRGSRSRSCRGSCR